MLNKTDQAHDFSGRALTKGDTVSTLNGSMTGRISDIALEEETVFVCVRPAFQPYARGVWHAADRVLFVAASRRQHK